jgi:hypothetical protein
MFLEKNMQCQSLEKEMDKLKKDLLFYKQMQENTERLKEEKRELEQSLSHVKHQLYLQTQNQEAYHEWKRQAEQWKILFGQDPLVLKESLKEAQMTLTHCQERLTIVERERNEFKLKLSESESVQERLSLRLQESQDRFDGQVTKMEKQVYLLQKENGLLREQMVTISLSHQDRKF